MELSSDTIRSASVAVSSGLRDEELDAILAMNWWFDKGVEDNRPGRAQRQKQKVIEQSSSLVPAAALTKEDVNEIVSRRLDCLRNDLIPPSAKAGKWWERPIGGAIAGGLVVLTVSGTVGSVISLYSRDSTTIIAHEITKQLGRRTAKDSESLNNQIAAEVGKQLSPIRQQIAGLSQDIGKIKDHLGIVRNLAPSAGPSRTAPVDVGLRRFGESSPTRKKESRTR